MLDGDWSSDVCSSDLVGSALDLSRLNICKKRQTTIKPSILDAEERSPNARSTIMEMSPFLREIMSGQTSQWND
jgi:hypothetical protein